MAAKRRKDFFFINFQLATLAEKGILWMKWQPCLLKKCIFCHQQLQLGQSDLWSEDAFGEPRPPARRRARRLGRLFPPYHLAALSARGPPTARGPPSTRRRPGCWSNRRICRERASPKWCKSRKRSHFGARESKEKPESSKESKAKSEAVKENLEAAREEKEASLNEAAHVRERERVHVRGRNNLIFRIRLLLGQLRQDGGLTRPPQQQQQQ